MKKVRVLSGAANGFCLRREAALALLAANGGRRFVAQAKALCGSRQYPVTHTFIKIFGGTPRKIFNILGPIPNPQKHKNANLLGGIAIN